MVIDSIMAMSGRRMELRCIGILMERRMGNSILSLLRAKCKALGSRHL
jgi:hypothetical protein